MKLDRDKVRLIIVLHEKAGFNTKTISNHVKTSRRRVQQIVRQYKLSGKIPELKEENQN